MSTSEIATLLAIVVPVAGLVWYIMNHHHQWRKMVFASIITLVVTITLLVTVAITANYSSSQPSKATPTLGNSPTVLSSAISERQSPTPPLTVVPPSSSFQEVIKGFPRVVFDPLGQNSNALWLDNHDTCTFAGNAYHAINRTDKSLTECYANNVVKGIDTHHMAFQVDMKLTGNYGGIGFGNVGGDRYFFSINSSNQYQVHYPSHGWFSCFNGNSEPQPEPKQPQALCPTSDYSANQTVQLQMVIQGNAVGFYVNGKLNWLGPNLGISSPGTIMFSAGYFQINADISFQNLQVWQLSS